MLVSTEMQRNSEWGSAIGFSPMGVVQFSIHQCENSFIFEFCFKLVTSFVSLFDLCVKKVYMCFFSIFTRHTILTFMNLPFNPILSFCKELQAQMGLSFGPFVCTERISSVHHGIFNVTSF